MPFCAPRWQQGDFSRISSMRFPKQKHDTTGPKLSVLLVNRQLACDLNEEESLSGDQRVTSVKSTSPSWCSLDVTTQVP